MLLPEDAINRRELCEVCDIPTAGMSPSAISEQGKRIKDKLKLNEWQHPISNGFLYSKKEVLKAWASRKALPKAA